VPFVFDEPVKVGAGSRGSLIVSLNDADERVYLGYQIDASIYDDGELKYHPNLRKKGDLAWQVRYRRAALGSSLVTWGYGIGLMLSGLVVSIMLWRWPKRNAPGKYLSKTGSFRRKKNQYWMALVLFMLVAIFYMTALLRPGIWIGPTDFSKDVSYVRASAEAVKSGQWPAWSHYTCGGMQLLGNPEGNTLSLGTVFALVPGVSAERALWLLLAVEAGLAAAGTLLLARSLRVSMSGSVLAGIIVGLSAVFPYKIAEGISMVGGAVAFTPWALLGMVLALRNNSWRWAMLSALSLVAMFWRGDVHIILGVIAVMVGWVIVSSLQKKSWRPIAVLVLIGAVFALGASVKVLPYLEQADQLNAVTPHSVQLTQEKLWDDVLLEVDSRFRKIPVLHGLPAHYGYIGSYVGLVPMVLALVGLFMSRRYRWHFIVALVITLLLVEGTAYEYGLRHIPTMDSLLRMATRLMTILVLLIALLAGMGFDRGQHLISGLLPKVSAAWWRALKIVVILLVGLNLMTVSWLVLQANLVVRSFKDLPDLEQPMLSPHINYSLSNTDQHHASELIAAGYLLPQICGDQNHPPEFLASIDKSTPLADNEVSIKPNEIQMRSVTGPDNVVIRERFVSSWVSSVGTVLPAEDGSIQVILPAQAPDNIYLRFVSVTLRGQQILLLLMVVIIFFSLSNKKILLGV